MKHHIKALKGNRPTARLFAVAVTALTLLALASPGLAGGAQSSGGGVTTYTGTLSDGTTYLMEVPANWNGTLFLYSHGLQSGTPQPEVSIDTETEQWLLSQGFALAGGSYTCTGCTTPAQWAASQVLVLDRFYALVGQPSRTIAWGHSQGGTVTAQLVQDYPNRLSGALPFCAQLSGDIAYYNERLDEVFVLKTLLAPNSSLPLVDIGFGHGQELAAANEELQIGTEAQQSALGRARFALAQAMVDRPDWPANANAPEPNPSDFVQREHNQFQWFSATFGGYIADALRSPLEAEVGTLNPTDGSVTDGNFSWNTNVDYGQQLAQSTDLGLVQGLYAQAGASLSADLATLAQAPRIAADPGAVQRLSALVPPPNGDFGGVPVLTVHTEGDYINIINEENAYADYAARAGDSGLLQQLTVNRGGHCEFTSAEQVTAIGVLLSRLNSGSWPTRSASVLNATAGSFPQDMAHLVADPKVPGSVAAPAFVDTPAPPYLRPFSAQDLLP